jgi:hypothetical protein
MEQVSSGGTPEVPDKSAGDYYVLAGAFEAQRHLIAPPVCTDLRRACAGDMYGWAGAWEFWRIDWLRNSAELVQLVPTSARPDARRSSVWKSSRARFRTIMNRRGKHGCWQAVEPQSRNRSSGFNPKVHALAA